jgi:hypothetical protein
MVSGRLPLLCNPKTASGWLSSNVPLRSHFGTATVFSRHSIPVRVRLRRVSSLILGVRKCRYLAFKDQPLLGLTWQYGLQESPGTVCAGLGHSNWHHLFDIPTSKQRLGQLEHAIAMRRCDFVSTANSRDQTGISAPLSHLRISGSREARAGSTNVPRSKVGAVILSAPPPSGSTWFVACSAGRGAGAVEVCVEVDGSLVLGTYGPVVLGASAMFTFTFRA